LFSARSALRRGPRSARSTVALSARVIPPPTPAKTRLATSLPPTPRASKSWRSPVRTGSGVAPPTPRTRRLWCPGANSELAKELLHRRSIVDGPELFDLAAADSDAEHDQLQESLGDCWSARLPRALAYDELELRLDLEHLVQQAMRRVAVRVKADIDSSQRALEAKLDEHRHAIQVVHKEVCQLDARVSLQERVLNNGDITERDSRSSQPMQSSLSEAEWRTSLKAVGGVLVKYGVEIENLSRGLQEARKVEERLQDELLSLQSTLLTGLGRKVEQSAWDESLRVQGTQISEIASRCLQVRNAHENLQGDLAAFKHEFKTKFGRKVDTSAWKDYIQSQNAWMTNMAIWMEQLRERQDNFARTARKTGRCQQQQPAPLDFPHLDSPCSVDIPSGTPSHAGSAFTTAATSSSESMSPVQHELRPSASKLASLLSASK